MVAAKKAQSAMKYQLSGGLKKNGVNLWRFVFSATESQTARESIFFIELEMLNPYLSPSDVVLGFLPRLKISEEDLQNVLAGTQSAKEFKTETLMIPSYVVIRAGIFGRNAKQVSEYFPIKDISVSNRTFEIHSPSCYFDSNSLKGSLSCISSDVENHPEWFCDSGSISWNLRYELDLSSLGGYKSSEMNWRIPGIKTVFSGSIEIDGRKFDVIPQKSSGYIDRNWGKTYPEQWFHLSSRNLSSIISGKVYLASCFALQGVYENKISFIANFEGQEYSFSADSGKHSYSSSWSCIQMPETDEEERLHWSASVNSGSHVLDVDVFCPAKILSVRTWEMPEGNRKILKILTGGQGNGEIRLYKRHGKNLELLEHCRISNVLCEYGQIENQETF